MCLLQWRKSFYYRKMRISYYSCQMLLLYYAFIKSLILKFIHSFIHLLVSKTSKFHHTILPNGPYVLAQFFKAIENTIQQKHVVVYAASCGVQYFNIIESIWRCHTVQCQRLLNYQVFIHHHIHQTFFTICMFDLTGSVVCLRVYVCNLLLCVNWQT